MIWVYEYLNKNIFFRIFSYFFRIFHVFHFFLYLKINKHSKKKVIRTGSFTQNMVLLIPVGTQLLFHLKDALPIYFELQRM
jgi:hypothetical protein